MKGWVRCAGWMLAAVISAQGRGGEAATAEATAIRIDCASLPGGVLIPGGEQKGQAAAIGAEGEVKFLRLSWDPARYRYLELMLNRPVALPEFAAAQAELTVVLPAASTAVQVGLRLMDSEGEIFQYTAPLRDKGADGKPVAPAAGVKTVSLLINPRSANGVWGGSGNKRLDYPLRLFGAGLDFVQNSPASWLGLAQITLTPLPDTRCAANYTLHHFDKMDLWQAQYAGGTGTLAQEEGGLRLQSQAPRVVLREKKWELRTEERPEALTLRARLLAGQASAQVIVQGMNGQRATLATVPMATGENALRLPLTGAEAEKLVGRVRLVALVLLTPDKNAQVLLQELGAEVRMDPLEAVTAEVRTGHPLPLLLPGREREWLLRLTNHAIRAITVRGRLTLTDGEEKAGPFLQEFTLAPGATLDWKPDWAPQRFGLWRVRCELSETMQPGQPGQVAAMNPAVRESEFAYLRPAGPTPGRAEGFLFGLCSHTEKWSPGEQELEALAAGISGAKIMRTDKVWSQIQPEPDKWKWAGLDGLVDLYGKQGLELQYLLMFPPRWACPPDIRKTTDWKAIMGAAPESAPWSAFVGAVCARYRGKIRYYEVWNEPDLYGFARFSSGEYVRLLKEAFAAARAADPEAKVMTGGFATLSEHGGRREWDFQANALRGGKGAFDVHAYHEHGPFETYARLVEEQFLPLRKATGADSVPWYANETAINSSWTGEPGQAATLYKKLLFAWSRGAIGYNWYDLRNDGFDQRDPENSFGLLTHDFRPKVAYPAYAALAGEYGGATYVAQLLAERGLWGFVFRKEADLLLPVWSERAAAPENLLVRTDAASAERVDMMGNRTALALREGLTLLEFAGDPATMRLKQAKRAEPAGALVAVGGERFLAPGRESRLQIRLRNPFAQPVRFHLNLATAAGVTTKQPQQEIEVASGGEQTAGYVLMQGQTAPGGAAQVVGGTQLRYTLAGIGWRGIMEVPLSRAMVIGSKAEYGAHPDIRLDQQKQIVPLFANDPNSRHLLWSGAADLSVSAWLRCEGGVLALKVAATDDAHKQPFAGSELWKGDCLQVALKKNGGAGCWEIGAALRDDGKDEWFVWNAPERGAGQVLLEKTRKSVTRSGGQVVYELQLPLEVLGLSAQDLREGIRFNFLVNDNDNGAREGWAEFAPRLGRDKAPDTYPLVVFE